MIHLIYIYFILNAYVLGFWMGDSPQDLNLKQVLVLLFFGFLISFVSFVWAFLENNFMFSRKGFRVFRYEVYWTTMFVEKSTGIERDVLQDAELMRWYDHSKFWGLHIFKKKR